MKSKIIMLSLAIGLTVLAHADTRHADLSTGQARRRERVARTNSGKKKTEGAPTNYGLPQAEVDRLLASRKIDVPYYRQQGEKCGIYALRMVMGYWNKLDPKRANPPAQAGEPGDAAIESLWTYARKPPRNAWSDGTTMHYDLRVLADAYGYKARATESPGGPGLNDIREEVKAGRPVLVSVRDVDDNGLPSTGKSFRYGGHWAVIEGFADGQDGHEYIIVKHGTSGGSVLWRAGDFIKAWDRNWRATVYVR